MHLVAAAIMMSLVLLRFLCATQVHVVARFDGGRDRSAVEEVAYQLKFVKRGKLANVEMLEPEDEMNWNIMLRGPADSPYARGLFSITFSFPNNYPYAPPNIKFNTPIFHPNVFPGGNVCWHENDTSGSKYFADVLIGAVNLLLEVPNPDSPANGEAGRMFTQDRQAYIRRAKRETEAYAFQ